MKESRVKMYFMSFLLGLVFMTIYTTPAHAKSLKLIKTITTEVNSDYNVSYTSKGLVSKMSEIVEADDDFKTEAVFKYYSDGRLKKATETMKSGGTLMYKGVYTYKYGKNKKLTKIKVNEKRVTNTTNTTYKVSVKKNKTVVTLDSYIDDDRVTYSFKKGYITKIVEDKDTYESGEHNYSTKFKIDKKGRKIEQIDSLDIITTKFTFKYGTSGNTVNRTLSTSGGNTRKDIFKTKSKNIKSKFKDKVMKQQANLYNASDSNLDDFLRWGIIY